MGDGLEAPAALFFSAFAPNADECVPTALSLQGGQNPQCIPNREAFSQEPTSREGVAAN
jgi:hypothetical protein